MSAITRLVRRTLVPAVAAGTTAALLLAAVPAQATVATVLPLGHQHLYATTLYQTVESVQPDGSETTAFTLAKHDWLESLSPNGLVRAVYTNKGLFVENRDGSHRRLLVAGSRSLPYAWTADSRSVLAYSAGGEPAIVHVRDGSRRLLNVAIGDSAAFTPDARYILANAPAHGWLLIRTSTGAVRSFRTAPCRQPRNLSFSPDGKRIAFTCPGSVGPVGWTGVMTVATGKVQRLANWRGDSPVWLGSTRVAVTYEQDNTLGNQVRVYDLHGKVVAAADLAARAERLFVTAH